MDGWMDGGREGEKEGVEGGSRAGTARHVRNGCPGISPNVVCDRVSK